MKNFEKKIRHLNMTFFCYLPLSVFFLLQCEQFGCLIKLHMNIFAHTSSLKAAVKKEESKKV